ncbi:helix-turn-helix domain-containing protein [Enteroscipio rubneri]
MDVRRTGELIRSLREERGLTQLQLAQLVGVGDKAVSKWERGVSQTKGY